MTQDSTETPTAQSMLKRLARILDVPAGINSLRPADLPHELWAFWNKDQQAWVRGDEHGNLAPTNCLTFHDEGVVLHLAGSTSIACVVVRFETDEELAEKIWAWEAIERARTLLTGPRS